METCRPVQPLGHVSGGVAEWCEPEVVHALLRDHVEAPESEEQMDFGALGEAAWQARKKG